MFKKSLSLVLLAAMLFVSSVAGAEVSNRDMQLMGGLVVSNATDAFFFCPMESGYTRHWGLYALSSPTTPIAEISDGIPARLVHADSTHVYFLGYTDAERTVHSLYSVEIATGQWEELLANIAGAFVDREDKFMYVSSTDIYTLYSYDIATRESAKLKDMSGSKKYIYDAIEYNGDIYFTTKTDSGTEDGFILNKNSGMANNLDRPNPGLVTGILYEGYRIYAADNAGTQVYSLRIGSHTGSRIGVDYRVSLASPRFGEYMYAYDGDNNQLIALPLDGAAPTVMPLQSSLLTRFVMGGTVSEVLLLAGSEVYAMPNDLSSAQKLFEFDSESSGQLWTNIAPAGDNAVLVMGYGPETYTHSATMPPTAVYAFDRAGGLLFSYPSYTGEQAEIEMPSAIGDVPIEPRGDGETYFNWNR